MDTSSNQPTSKQDYTLVDTEDPLASLIKGQLRDLDPIYRGSNCIYRVPPTLRQASEKSYTPQIVSIGPFHHGKKELGPWEEHKLWYLKTFLDRTEKRLEDCIKLVRDWERRALDCYEERIDLSSDAFVKMMLVDSCFIIESMLKNNLIVRRDMILLENQIPFFLLHGLFDFGEDFFIKLSIKYFSALLLTVTDMDRIFQNVKHHQEIGFEIEHLTDLLRICHLPTDFEKPYTANFVPVPIPTAARLYEAGIKFKTGTRVLDIQYNTTGLLEMPKLKVKDHTECLLRNLIALEMCHYPFHSYIIDYVFFMDMFIDTATDVDLLIKKGIIVNFLSDSAAVASLFNNLPGETAMHMSSYYFTSISKGINAYCNDPWHKIPWHEWKATFKRDYCSSPWKIASTAAAIILLVLTLIQTIFSII